MTGLLQALYWYCTDFCINAANLLGTTYAELNFWLFLVAFPGSIALLLTVDVARWVALSSRRRSTPARAPPADAEPPYPIRRLTGTGGEDGKLG